MIPTQAAYDRAITVFSPDGRIFQVEYALETVKRGTISLGIQSKHGVVLAAEEPFARFQDKSHSRKLFIIDRNIGGAISGYVPDGRVLIDYAREFCQYQRILYDEPPYVDVVARRIGNIKQGFTQQGGIRPFGVAIIFGGINPDGTPAIYVTDPSGSFIKYVAAAIGADSDSALDFIEKYYNPDADLEELKVLAAGAILYASRKKNIGKKEAIEIRFLEIGVKDMEAKFIGVDEAKKYIEMAKQRYEEL